MTTAPLLVSALQVAVPQYRSDTFGNPMAYRMVACALMSVLLACSSSDEQARRDYPHAEGDPIGRWEKLPYTSGSMRISASAVLTDEQYVIWGGEGSCNGSGYTCSSGRALDLDSLEWVPALFPPRNPGFVGRVTPIAAWTGEEILYWGGLGCMEKSWVADCADGAAFNPETETWRLMSTEGGPSPRAFPVSAWTGKELLVWGGGQSDPESNTMVILKPYGDGAAYDPATDTWRPIAEKGAPSPRLWHVGLWTGKELFVWGGESAFQDDSTLLADGALYDPETDSWRPVAPDDRLTPAFNLSAAWTGKEVLVWTSHDRDVMMAYNPETERWRPMDVRGPHGQGHCAAWSGKYFVAFGDMEGEPGALYEPEQDRWYPMGMDGIRWQVGWKVCLPYQGDILVFGPINDISGAWYEEGYRFVIP